MGSRTESAEHYQKALKAGKKAQKQMIHQGLYPHLPILDEILPEYPTATQEELGIIEIPADKIVGTKTRGRADAFAANFMPLIPDKSEFAMKWQSLCQYHLGDSGIRDPIFCYEFLGRFYVQEGNKRVSVLKYFDAASITGKVIRIVPGESTQPEVVAYKEFLTYYPKTKLYEIAFSRLNSFPKLQAALGHEADHVWTEEERRNFRSSFYYFNRAFEKLCAEPMIATPADALMRDFFQEQLNQLNQELIRMGAACEEIIALASRSLTDYSADLAKSVSTVGAQIDESERTIETICMKLLLRQQPVARDLRVISAAMKMITDMERIGDQCEDIVEIAPHITAHPDEKFPKIREMAKAAQAMVTEAVDAYVKQDLILARKVMAHDDVVDDYFTRIKSGIIDIIAAEPAHGEFALDLLMIAKYFERIGDHCTNIAEWVEFSVTGIHKDCQ